MRYVLTNRNFTKKPIVLPLPYIRFQNTKFHFILKRQASENALEKVKNKKYEITFPYHHSFANLSR